MVYISKSEQETREIACGIAQKLKGGEILALFGDLGSGKTTFTKGLADCLKVKKEVTSPTFVIMKKYDVSASEIKTLIHIDAYRLTSRQDAESIGLTEIFEGMETVSVIEWPENIWEALPKERVIKISFKYLNETERNIEVAE